MENDSHYLPARWTLSPSITLNRTSPSRWKGILSTPNLPMKRRLPTFQKKALEPSPPLIFAQSVENKTSLTKPEDLTSDDVIIVVMGPTGAGKSTFIQAATGVYGDLGVGHSLQPFISEINAVRVTLRDDKHVVLVDTPGFDDTILPDLQVLQVVATWLKNAPYKDPQISGILYLHRIVDDRMAGTPLRNMAMFRKLCGENFFEKVVLTTTMWPETEDFEGTKSCVAREKVLETNYWSAMIEQGSPPRRFMNTKESAWDIIDYIIAVESERQWTPIQGKMVADEKGSPSTEAGRELHSLMQELVERQNDILRRIEDDYRETGDKAVLHELLKAWVDLHGEQAKLVKDMRQSGSSASGFFARLRRRRIFRFLSRNAGLYTTEDIDAETQSGHTC